MHGRLIRLFHTARHLRAQQIYGRIRQCTRATLPRTSRDRASKGPGFPGCRWSGPKDLLPPVTDGMCLDAVKQGVFRFLNTAHAMGFPPAWDGDHQSRLWLYNLHYFDWLWLLDFDAARRAVLDWIARYRCTGNRAGWESYPTSLRLINWCGYFFGRCQNETEGDRDFCRTLWGSLYGQCEWLAGHLEIHLLNNHYLENGVALAFAGSCFQGNDARRWCKKGMDVLAGQIHEQILPDGTHFELSPMYHCRVLYVLVLLMETEVAGIAELLAEPVRRMSLALENLGHPDGGIALLSDSARDVCHQPEKLLVYSRRYGTSSRAGKKEAGSFALPDAGYYGWRGGDGAYLIADFGKIGPDHNPGHGHADLFNFELSLNGCRVVTDSGVHDYEASATRCYCRSTAAHNTVEIDGQDQCELWGTFRVARRGYPHDVTWCPDRRGFTLAGWHDGYTRLPGKPVHSRQMQWDVAEGLLVCDKITARRSVRCVSRLHLHPMCRIVESDSGFVRVSYPGGSFGVKASGDIGVEETPYFERFYESQTRPCLCFVGQGKSIELQYRISI